MCAYEERGLAVSEDAKKVRARKMIRELRNLATASSWAQLIDQSRMIERFSNLAAHRGLSLCAAVAWSHMREGEEQPAP